MRIKRVRRRFANRQNGWLPFAAYIAGSALVLLATPRAEAQTPPPPDTTLRRPTVIAPVLTTAEALAAKLVEVGFTHRRANSGAPASQFLTRYEIERRGVTDLAQLLRRMKGRAWGCGESVLFIDGVLQATPIPDKAVDTVKYTPSDIRGRNSAPPVVAVPMPRANPLEQIPVNSVDAMEVYAGPSEIPLEFKAAFRQARCVVAIWTR